MKKKNYKGRCIKKASKKSKEICRTYDNISFSYLKTLENDKSINEIRCNVPLDSEETADYTTDFLCIKANGELIVANVMRSEIPFSVITTILRSMG